MSTTCAVPSSPSLRSRNTGDGVRTYNLAAPDSPRWNEYFVDLALAISGHTGASPRVRGDCAWTHGWPGRR